MYQCQVCGNHYDKTFQVIMHDKTYHFDSFECAIQELAPTCSHCNCKIIGHGLESNGTFYCCAHCAHADGANKLCDRV